MPNPHPPSLRGRAVRAYEAGEGSYEAIAEQFEVSLSSLLRWVTQVRLTGDVSPRPRGGGWRSPVDSGGLEQGIADHPDAPREELRRGRNSPGRTTGAAAAARRSVDRRSCGRCTDWGSCSKKTPAPE